MLTKIRPLINDTQSIYLYKSKILPYFDYGDIFYNKTFSRTLLKLQKLQNRAMKLCMGKDARYNTNLLHVEAKIPLLEPRRIAHIVNFAHHRAHDQQYIRLLDRDLRGGDAPLLYEPFSRCESNLKCCVHDCLSLYVLVFCLSKLLNSTSLSHLCVVVYHRYRCLIRCCVEM